MDIDVTFFMQLALLTLVVVVLRPLLATPLMAVMDDRHRQIHGARAETRRMERLTALDKDAYQTKLASARHDIHKRRESMRQRGRDEARALEDSARKAALQTVLVHRAQVFEAQKLALTSLRQSTQARAQVVAGRLLGREVRP